MKRALLLFAVIGMLVSNPALSQPSASIAPIAYYPFNGNTTDESNNGYNGIANNITYVTDRFGTDQSACHFNGSTSSIDLGNVFNEFFAGPDKAFSFSAWIKPDQYHANNAIFIKSADNGCSENQRQIMFRIYQGKAEFEFFTNLNGYEGRYIGGNTSITDPAKWYHVVVTYDGSVDSNNGLDRVKIYVDNVEETTSFARASEGSLGDIQAGTAHAGIGATLNSNGQICSSSAGPFKGAIDDFRIFDFVLSKCDVNSLFNTSDAVAFYPFNGNALDESGNNFNGVAENVNFVTDRFGNLESACHFNGTSSNVGLGNIFNDVFAGTGKSFSFSVWVKPDDYNANNAIFIKSADNGCSENQRQIIFRIYQGKAEFEFFTNLNGYAGRYIGGSTAITDPAKWYHIVVTYDGAVNTNDGLDRVKIYVDNAPDETSFARTPESSLGDIQAGTAHCGIGATLNSNGEVCSSSASVFKGAIDDVYLYDRLLSECEVQSLFTAGETPVVTAPVKQLDQPAKEYLVLPNPSTGFFEISGLTVADEITVLSGSGQNVNARISGNTVDISPEASGIYFVRIKIGDTVSLVRLLKQ